MANQIPVRAQLHPGAALTCLTACPPGIQPGMKVAVVSKQSGPLYAVRLPDGELYRWFAGAELQPVGPMRSASYQPGDYAKVIYTEGHAPKIKKGMTVRIVKAIAQASFYDVKLPDGGYHRWLADFEVT